MSSVMCHKSVLVVEKLQQYFLAKPFLLLVRDDCLELAQGKLLDEACLNVRMCGSR